MALAPKFRGAPPVLQHTVPMAPEHSPVAATVLDGAGQCPLCGVDRTLSECIATSQFDPNVWTGCISQERLCVKNRSRCYVSGLFDRLAGRGLDGKPDRQA
jgi:hypothetical protein